jgi:hypothetical protein
MKFQPLMIGLLTVSTIAMAPAAQALPTVFKAPDDSVWVKAAVSGEASMTYLGQMAVRRANANACGLASFNPSTTNPTPPTFTFGGQSVTTVNLPTQLVPPCTGGVLAEARTANFKTADGRIVIVGQTASAPVEIQYPRDRVRQGRQNACGYVRFTSSQSNQHTGSTTFQVASTTYTLSSLVSHDVLCRSSNGVGKLYEAVGN